jgi:SAM-dependent methyltransferase
MELIFTTARVNRVNSSTANTKGCERMHALTTFGTGQGYDRIADIYEYGRSKDYCLDYARIFLAMLPKPENDNASLSIFDIGCGTGIPITQLLVTSGAKVIGMDTSPVMIGKSGENVPEATFLVDDISTSGFEGKFGGILAWDSLFHLPLEKQEETLRKIIGMLNPNGVLLFNAGGQAGELRSLMYGTEFYYGSLASAYYEKIIREEGCQTILNEIDNPRSHGHRVVCCRKNSTDTMLWHAG